MPQDKKIKAQIHKLLQLSIETIQLLLKLGRAALPIVQLLGHLASSLPTDYQPDNSPPPAILPPKGSAEGD